MNHLNNLYEEGRLHGCKTEEELLDECENGEDRPDNCKIKDPKKIILNQSTLGTLKTKKL